MNRNVVNQWQIPLPSGRGIGCRSRPHSRPATFIIDRPGTITYTYIGSNQFDLAEQDEILDHLDSLT